MIALSFVIGLLLLACLALVSIGCRAIVQLCGQLERDRRNEYRIARPLARTEPQWMRGAAR